MTAHRPRSWLGFVPAAVLAALALFVVHGAAGGVLGLLALLTFAAAAIHALRGQDVSKVDGTGWTAGR